MKMFGIFMLVFASRSLPANGFYRPSSFVRGRAQFFSDSTEAKEEKGSPQIIIADVPESLRLNLAKFDKDNSGSVDLFELLGATSDFLNGRDAGNDNRHVDGDAAANISILRNQLEIKKKEIAVTEMTLKFLETEMSRSNARSGSPAEYGFLSKSNGCEVISTDQYGRGVPMSAMTMSFSNFNRELENFLEFVGAKALLKNVGINIKSDSDNEPPLSEEYEIVQAKLKQLQLSNDAIWKRELSRKEVKAPWVIKLPYLLLCYLLDQLFDGKPISRFYFLETVARMPYFSYITMLHAYETLGWWRRSTEAKRVHFAEEYNEYHHLLIMESLGGDQEWVVRFMAQHASIAYYFILILAWVVSPTLAYNFSELIEAHAVDTYAEFAESSKAILETLGAPKVAKDYYEGLDMYVFDEFQTSREKGSRRPRVDTLYDVFCNIRDDEGEHVATMSACQDPQVLVQSPNTEAALAVAAVAAALAGSYLSSSAGLPDLQSLPDFQSLESAGSAALQSLETTDGGELATDVSIIGTIIQFLAPFWPLL